MTVLFDRSMSHDYQQIYLCDSRLPPLPVDYTDEAIARRVMAAPGAVILHIARSMPVPVRVVLHERRPALDLGGLDHAAECGLAAPSGLLVLAGLLDYEPAAPRLPIPAGRLGLIATFEGLGSLSPDGLEGSDRYGIHLWPSPQADEAVVVLKAFGR